jgi:hypothetical protein
MMMRRSFRGRLLRCNGAHARPLNFVAHFVHLLIGRVHLVSEAGIACLERAHGGGDLFADETPHAKESSRMASMSWSSAERVRGVLAMVYAVIENDV